MVLGSLMTGPGLGAVLGGTCTRMVSSPGCLKNEIFAELGWSNNQGPYWEAMQDEACGTRG